MNNIISSASKLVLLFLVLILGTLALVSGIHAVWTASYTDADKAIMTAFTAALTFVFGFYFNSKGDPGQPMAGK